MPFIKPVDADPSLVGSWIGPGEYVDFIRGSWTCTYSVNMVLVFTQNDNGTVTGHVTINSSQLERAEGKCAPYVNPSPTFATTPDYSGFSSISEEFSTFGLVSGDKMWGEIGSVDTRSGPSASDGLYFQLTRLPPNSTPNTSGPSIIGSWTGQGRLTEYAYGGWTCGYSADNMALIFTQNDNGTVTGQLSIKSLIFTGSQHTCIPYVPPPQYLIKPTYNGNYFSSVWGEGNITGYMSGDTISGYIYNVDTKSGELAGDTIDFQLTGPPQNPTQIPTQNSTPSPSSYLAGPVIGGILVAGAIGVYVGYKIYLRRKMSRKDRPVT